MVNDPASNEGLALGMTIALISLAAAIVVALAVGGHRMLTEIEQGGAELNRVLDGVGFPR